MITGINLTVKNTTKDQIAVTFNYSGEAGGQATWTWLKPGESTSVYNATGSGPDVYNSYVYSPSTGKQLKFESKLAAWTSDTTITVDGSEYELDRGQSKSDNKQGHAITVSRGSSDIVLPMTYWIDGMKTVTPDMVPRLHPLSTSTTPDDGGRAVRSALVPVTRGSGYRRPTVPLTTSYTTSSSWKIATPVLTIESPACGRIR